MHGYLGETPVNDLKGTPFEGFTKEDWAMRYIQAYGGIDGAHHKTWVLDQVARILKGTPVHVSLAKWDGKEGIHQEYRYDTGEPSKEYHDWVKECRGEWNEEHEEYEYSYDVGIAP